MLCTKRRTTTQKYKQIPNANKIAYDAECNERNQNDCICCLLLCFT